jgi:hypothetical protein
MSDRPRWQGGGQGTGGQGTAEAAPAGNRFGHRLLYKKVKKGQTKKIGGTA